MNTMRKTLQGDREDTNALDTPSEIGPDSPEVFPTVRRGRVGTRQVTIRVRNVARSHPSAVRYGRSPLLHRATSLKSTDRNGG
jgi:hypothetical protein